MDHNKQRQGLFVPIEVVTTQEAFFKSKGTKNSWNSKEAEKPHVTPNSKLDLILV